MSHVSDFLVWGNNQSNLLSKSSSKCLSTPVPLSLPYNIVSICASEKHISFLTKEGLLYSYGSNLDGRLGVSTRSIDKTSFSEPIEIEVGSKVIRAESGFSHMCILTEKLELFSWGLGDYGALGTGQFKSRSTPTRVDMPRQMISKLRQISCGAMHTAFLFEDGSVYTCGSNQYGQLGVNKPEKVSTPLPISFHIPVHQISCGVFYTLLLTKEGKVYGMGNNKYGQLGTGHKVNECHPTLIRQLNDIVKVTAGYHSGAIDKFGNLFIWGSGSFGELLRPKKFVLSVPIKDIAIRGFFGVAIGHTSKNQNRIYSWGNNTFGQLGLGNYDASKEPQEVETLRGLEVNKIALGVNFAMVLLHPPSIHSRLVQQDYAERQKSQNKYKRQQNRSQNAGISDRKSIIGFEQKYLSSNRKNSEDHLTIKSKSKDSSLFEGIRSQRHQGAERSHYNEKQKLQPATSRPKADDLRDNRNSSRQNKSPQIGKFDYQYDSKQEKRPEKYERSQRLYQPGREKQSLNQPYNSLTKTKDYQKLFIQLSSDYEALVKKYVQLQRQIEFSKTHDFGSLKLMQDREKQLVQQNLTLKNQISKLSYDIILLNDENRTLNRRNQDILRENERVLYEQARSSTITLSPLPSPIQVPLSAQIQQEYNKLLTQKEQIITKLNLSLAKTQDQFKVSLTKLTNQNQELKRQLNFEMQNNRKIIDEHQSLIDELEMQIKKSQQLACLLKQENQSLKLQSQGLKDRNMDLERVHARFSEATDNEKLIKQKYETNLKESVIKGEAMTSRIAQLEIQLGYEKQFNQKYQDSIMQIKQNNEKLHRQLHAQADLNIERNNKIQNLKLQVQKYKKYKKEVDQKNIQIEQFNQQFQNFKKKSRQIVEQKQREIKFHQQELERKTNQFSSSLDKKALQIQDLHRENTRLDKQLTKYKQNISFLKNQIAIKTDQIQHLTQQKGNMEKKVNILAAQIGKEIEERENIVKELGECKRQLTRLKIANNQLESKLGFEIEQKEKSIKSNTFKDEEISKLKDQNIKLNDKCENLKKENTTYREQIEDLSYQLEGQTKINGQLAKANRQFAQGQNQFSQKITQLQNKIYQLEDENKSYTPRYEALLIRNRELDERNRELGQMINKAIEIQAQSYKNNILKQVEINTDNIINQFKEEQEFQFRGKRNKNRSKQVQEAHDEANFTKRGQKSSVVVKEEPYTKMMKERITQHKRKVSQSAQKLANLLDLNDKSKSKDLPERHQTEDYQKINSQMESFNNQKQEFMSKIHSFAEKLKII